MNEKHLIYEASIGCIKKVKTLLNEGAEINAGDTSNLTALHWAVNSEDTRMTEFLIMRGADINRCSIFDGTPLIGASYSKNDYLTTLLINNRADVNVQHNTGNTALHYAACSGNRKKVESLLKAKADVKIRNRAGQLPIDRVDLGIKASFQELFNEAELNFEIEDPKTTLTSKKSSL